MFSTKEARTVLTHLEAGMTWREACAIADPKSFQALAWQLLRLQKG